MLLKVGELARSTGLTVRTLHHYDSIGLLKPSGRSESGYRLYSRDDVARLHSVQALRHLGLPLADIAQMLAGEGGSPIAIIERQMQALDGEIAKAGELREQLALIRDGIVSGAEPAIGDWLDTLSLMATYTKYFSASELRQIFTNWREREVQAQWMPIMAQVREAMDAGLKPDSLEVQPLVNRWMGLMVHWMDGDFELMDRWGQMFRQEPSAQGRNQAPEGDMIAFIEEAVELRLSLLGKYFTPEELRGFGRVPPGRWRALETGVQELISAGVPPQSQAALAVAQTWMRLMELRTNGDAALRGRLLRALAAEPLLKAGSELSAPARDYLVRALQAAGLTLT
jgi:DNA-binding transcriptional MerR regulator